MKIVQLIQISQKEFYDYLVHSLMLDIYKYTNEYISRDELKHFQYKKPFKSNKNQIEANVEIIDLKEPTIYESKITLGNNINTIKYEILQENDQTKVIYYEEVHSSKKLQELNYQFISFLLKKSYQKKMKNKIKNIENHIIRSKT